MKDAYEAMMNVRFEDGFYDEEDEVNWEKKEKEDFRFCVGEKEQLSLATKTVRILAGIRKRSGK